MAKTHGWMRGRWLRRTGLVAAVVTVSTALVVLGAAPARGDVNTGFELDGNVLDDPASTPPDWGASSGSNSIFTVSSGVGVPRSPLPANFLSAGFSRDFIPGSNADTTTYTNGSKDTANISTGWACVKANNVTDKGDIQNGYAAAFIDPATQHLILYFGMEKNASNGDNNMGVWFLQDSTVGCNNPNGGAGLPFTGNHTDGDILLVAAFTSGGSNPIVNAYRWNGGAGGSLGTTALSTGGKCGGSASDICAITNTASVTTPWQTVDKVLGQGTTLSTDQFYEGAVDLTANHLDTDSSGNPICVNKFVFDTRASQSLGSTLFDYTEGSVQTCASPSISTNLFRADTNASLAPPNNTVTLPVNVYDTASLTGALGTPTGTVTYSLWANNTCTTAATNPTFPGGGNTATVTIAADGTITNSPTLLFDTPGNFWWQAHYSGGGRNAAADSVCTSEPLVVQPVQPSIATTPNPTSLTIGNGASFNDTATISNGYFPSGGIAPGDVTFNLYGPFSTAGAITCTGTPAFTSTNAASRVTDTTASATSGSFTPTTVGVYQWTAHYAGNTQNLSADSGCNVAAEQVTVSPVTPSLASTILLSDRAKVTGVPGAGNPVGTVQFQLFPSSDCTGTTLHDETVTISAAGLAETTSATAVPVAGTYAWKVTFTPGAGNPNYTGAATTCTGAQSDETATISYAGNSPIH